MLQTLSGTFGGLNGRGFISTLLGSVRRHSVVSVWCYGTLLLCLGYEIIVNLDLRHGFIFVFQESGIIIAQNLISDTLLNLLPLLNFFRSINFSSLLNNSGLLIINIDVDYVIFMEFFGPPWRYPIFDLVFKLLHIGLLGQSLVNTVLVQLVELVVEFGDHLLDVLCFFFLVKLVDYRLLDVSLSVSRDDVATPSNN